MNTAADLKIKLRQTLYNRKWGAHRCNLQFENVFGKFYHLYSATGLYLLEYYNMLSNEPEETYCVNHDD